MLLCFFIPIPNPIHFSLGLEAKIKNSFIPMRGGRESSTGHVSVADWVLSCFCPKVRFLDKAVGERIKRQRLQWTNCRQIGGGDVIPHICHGRHGRRLCKFFWPV